MIPEAPRLVPVRPAPALFPNVEVIERVDEIVVRAGLPGVKKEDVDISVFGTLLTLACRTQDSSPEETGRYCCAELPHGAFSRVIELPAEVEGGGALATLKDGLLEVRLAKPDKARRGRIRIE